MTHPPSGGTPDPYRPPQPYGPAEGITSGAAERSGHGQPGAPVADTAPAASVPYAGPGAPVAYPAPGAPDVYTASGAPAAYAAPGASELPYGYGPPYGGYGGPGYAAVRGTNTLAILALVFAFVFPLAGIVLGHVAKRQIRTTGEEGRGLATAGLWFSYVFSVIGLIGCTLYGALFGLILLGRLTAV